MCFPPRHSQWSFWFTDPFENMTQGMDTLGKMTQACTECVVLNPLRSPSTDPLGFLSFPDDKNHLFLVNSQPLRLPSGDSDSMGPGLFHLGRSPR